MILESRFWTPSNTFLDQNIRHEVYILDAKIDAINFDHGPWITAAVKQLMLFIKTLRINSILASLFPVKISDSCIKITKASF